MVERLNSSMARGYIDHLDAEHRSMESESHGLAAIATAIRPVPGRDGDRRGRSLRGADGPPAGCRRSVVTRTRCLQAGSLGRPPNRPDRGIRKESGASGYGDGQIQSEAGINGRQVLIGGWNALRAELRVRGRTIGAMTVGTMFERIFGMPEFLFVAAVADQFAIALERARLLSSHERCSRPVRY